MRRNERLVTTYSIVGVDRERGLMGGAVQSHAFAVGSIVVWARAGVGVVATQSVVNPNFGPRGLAALAEGHPAPNALDALLADDDAPAVRQVSLITPDGVSATHTGERCIAEAGHIRGDGYSVQANMMDRTGVPEAMAEAWNGSTGPLPERLLSALKAAEGAGGDIRGRQSASLTVVSTTPRADIVEAMPLDVRVDDHPDPLGELERLMRLHAAYRHIDEGDEASARGESEAAREHYTTARRLAPDRVELAFWEALANAGAGDIEGARRQLESIDRAGDDRWRRLSLRLPPTGLIALDAEGWDELVGPRPRRIYHVITDEPWDAAGVEYRPGAFESEGFVHCSFAHQISSVIRRHFPSTPDPLLLEIDRAAVDDLLRLEVGDTLGEAYPHLYGAIPKSAVVRHGTAAEILPAFR